VLRTCQQDATKTELWKFFLAIEKTADPSRADESAGDSGLLSGDRSADVTAIPYAQCRKCAKVLTYDKVKGGTLHLRCHATACQSAAVPSNTTQISQFFKSSSVILAVKQDRTLKCADFACRESQEARIQYRRLGVVIYSRRNSRKSPKWQRNYLGPFLIVRAIPPVNYVLQHTSCFQTFVVHVDKLKRRQTEKLSWTNA